MSAPIKCPKCKSATMAIVTFQDVEVDRCPQCNGIWFALLELEDLRKITFKEFIRDLFT